MVEEGNKMIKEGNKMIEEGNNMFPLWGEVHPESKINQMIKKVSNGNGNGKKSGICEITMNDGENKYINKFGQIFPIHRR
jgi:hypothetical protein